MSRRSKDATAARVLVVGVGSPHGDDQLGWLAVQKFQQHRDGASPTDCHCENVCVERLQTPADLLDVLAGHCGLDRLVVCDVLEAPLLPGESAGPRIHCWRWPTGEIVRLRSAVSHALSLPEVLQMAAVLGQLPPEVWLVALEGCRFDPMAAPSAESLAALPSCVAAIGAASRGTASEGIFVPGLAEDRRPEPERAPYEARMPNRASGERAV